MNGELVTKPGDGLIPDGLTAEDEVVAKRRQNSKTYALDEGRFQLMVGQGPVHYKENDEWQDIDLAIVDDLGRLVVHKAPYDLEVYTDRIGYSYTSKRGGRVLVELIEIDDQPVGNVPIRHEGRQVFWDNLTSSLDVKCSLRSAYVEVFKRLADESAPRQFKWCIEEDVEGRARLIPKTAGVDAEGHALNIENTVGEKERLDRDGIAYDRYTFEERWTGQVSRVIDETTRQKEWSYDVAYPVIIDATTGDIDIAANNDDGHEYLYKSGGATVRHEWKAVVGVVSKFPIAYSTNVAETTYTYTNQGGLRFISIGVPQGATVTSATLKVKVQSRGGANQQIKWYADNVDDAAAWANNNLPTGIAKTPAAGIAWTPATNGWHSLSVTSPVQTVLNRGGWSSNNAMRFAGLLAARISGRAWIYDYNGGQGNAAKLVIIYELPTAALWRCLTGVGI